MKAKTWEKITDGLVLIQGNVAIMFNMVENEQGDLFATHGTFVLRSFDGGDSWDGVYPLSGVSGILEIALNSEGHIFTTGNASHLFRSTNYGDDWDILFQDLLYLNDIYQPLLFYPNSQIGYVNLITSSRRRFNSGNRSWIVSQTNL